MLPFILAGLVLISLIIAVLGSAKNIIVYIGIAIILTDIALLISFAVSMK